MDGAEKFNLVAGHVALDFANTLDDRFNPDRTKELLAEYEDLLTFARLAGVLKKSQAKCLRELRQEQKEAALVRARLLREAMEEIFSSVARQEPAPDESLDVLNTQLRGAVLHRLLVQKEEGGFRWKWLGAEEDAASPLWPIALAAGDLLQSDELRFVRECGSETCRWLFLDLSKNHSRRWCDMKTCGNRSKARRFYEKRTASG